MATANDIGNIFDICSERLTSSRGGEHDGRGGLACLISGVDVNLERSSAFGLIGYLWAA